MTSINQDYDICHFKSRTKCAKIIVMEFIENRTFDEINLGDSASLVRTLTRDDIDLFAVMSGDVNPAHVDEEYARSDMFHKIIAHGMWGGALISTLLGTKLPGPGTIYLGQTLRFKRPVALGDTITVSVTATSKDEAKHRIGFDCECVNQMGDVVISGSAEVIAPAKKVKRPRTILPAVHLHDHEAQYRQLIARTEDLPPLRTAVVHPVDRDSLLAVRDAFQADLISPILVGPRARIEAAAETEGIDLSGFSLIPTEHSHAAAAKAVELARAGEVEALLKGSLPLSELMDEILARDTGLRTGRRMSQVSVMDVPTYPRPLFITDTGLNVYPNLANKRDIVQNAIDLAQALGIETPKVAILSAVTTIDPNLPSGLEAAALCKMVERKQIGGGIVDGPLAFDDAVSPEAAGRQQITSPVAGQADILVAPDLETGTMLVKQLNYLAEAQTTDIILGARVPIALTGHADNALTRAAPSAIALLLARHSWRPPL